MNVLGLVLSHGLFCQHYSSGLSRLLVDYFSKWGIILKSVHFFLFALLLGCIYKKENLTKYDKSIEKGIKQMKEHAHMRIIFTLS